MSIFSRLQRALGFSYEDEEPDHYEPLQSGTATALAVSDSSSSGRSQAEGTTEDDGEDPGKRDKETRQEHGAPDIDIIFQGVVEFLNRELPPYIRQSLNEETQRRYIYSNLDSAVREYLGRLVEAEKKSVQSTREREKDKMRRNYEESKEKLKVLEEQLARETEKAMSHERQKRALSLRITDLESKIAALDAEREQYDLENRSLMNRLRAAEVRASWSGNADEINQKVEELDRKSSELEALKETLEKEKGELDGLREAISREQELLAKEKEEIERFKRDFETVRANFEKEKEQLSSHCEELKKENELLAVKNDALQNEKVEMTRTIESLQADMRETASGKDDRVSDYTPGYSFISFDDEAKPKSVQPKPKKKQPIQKPVEKNPVADLLDDTDWLVEAGKDVDNPDRVVTPGDKNGGPEQLSLW